MGGQEVCDGEGLVQLGSPGRSGASCLLLRCGVPVSLQGLGCLAGPSLNTWIHAVCTLLLLHACLPSHTPAPIPAHALQSGHSHLHGRAPPLPPGEDNRAPPTGSSPPTPSPKEEEGLPRLPTPTPLPPTSAAPLPAQLPDLLPPASALVLTQLDPSWALLGPRGPLASPWA